MVNLLKIVLLCLVTLSISAQNTKNNTLAVNENSNIGIFEFESEVINYGSILQNADGNRSFSFKNIGNAPIVIIRLNLVVVVPLHQNRASLLCLEKLQKLM